MEDKVYQDPFDLEFPDVSDSEELVEAKEPISEEIKTFIEKLLPALKNAMFVPRDGKLDELDQKFLDALDGRGYQPDDTYRIKFWKQCHLVACPTLESGSLSEVRTLASGSPVGSLQQAAVAEWKKDTYKALIKAIPLPKQFKGVFYSNKFPVPAFVCVDPKECISQELYDEIKQYSELPRLRAFGPAFAASPLKNSIVIGCYFLEGKEPVLRLALKVREAFRDKFSDFIELPGVKREPKIDKNLEGTEPGTSVKVEDDNKGSTGADLVEFKLADSINKVFKISFSNCAFEVHTPQDKIIATPSSVTDALSKIAQLSEDRPDTILKLYATGDPVGDLVDWYGPEEHKSDLSAQIRKLWQEERFISKNSSGSAITVNIIAFQKGKVLKPGLDSLTTVLTSTLDLLEAAQANTEETSKTEETTEIDHFETEEFKAALKEIGFTEAQIERLYKSGALQAILQLSTEEDEEGDE